MTYGQKTKFEYFKKAKWHQKLNAFLLFLFYRPDEKDIYNG